MRSWRSIAIASAVPSIFSALASAAKPIGPAALLLPRTGAHAALARSMERAARLAQGSDGAGLVIYDTAGTPTGAAAAARDALRHGASILLGPLLRTEVPPVLAVAQDKVPVIAFSNDAALLESGAFLLGITAAQGVAPILRYARGRGVRRVALLADDAGWGAQAIVAGNRSAKALDLDLIVMPALTEIAALQGMTGGIPDAVLTVDGVAVLDAPGERLREAGIQLLAAFKGADITLSALAGLEGVWLTAPDPTRFASFADTYEGANGSSPGVIAGLAYDAATIAARLRRNGPPDRSAILTANGFKGVCGDIRFRADGSAAREMAILIVQQGRVIVADHSSGV